MQKCGVVDLGSNSVRLVVYDVADAGKKQGKRAFSPLIDVKKMVGLSSYVEGGVLSQEGIGRASDALQKHLRRASLVGCDDVAIFATAVLRNCANSREAIDQIQDAIDHPIALLSGEDEAHLDFVGATCDRAVEEGTLVDIGGGSTELVAIRKGKDVRLASLGLGSVSAYRQFVGVVLPTAKERRAMVQDIVWRLGQEGGPKEYKAKTLYGVGGSARALAKLKSVRQGNLKVAKCLDRADLDQMLQLLEEDPSAFAHAAARAVPDRLHTIGCGLALLHCLMESLGARRLEICRYGVREGFLIERVLGWGKSWRK